MATCMAFMFDSWIASMKSGLEGRNNDAAELASIAMTQLSQ